MKVALCLFFFGFLLSSSYADHDIHAKIDQCNVTGDSECLRSILHELAYQGGTVSAASLMPGDYHKIGSSHFCPQNISRIASEGGIAIRVSYTSPCSASDDMNCSGAICQVQGGTRVLTVLSASSYNYHDDAVGYDTFVYNGSINSSKARASSGNNVAVR